MTPEELESAVTPDGRRLTVALGDLSAGLASGLGRFVPPGGHLVLDDASVVADTADGRTVTGTGVAEPFTGMAVTATFAAVAGAVTVTIQASGDDTWSFATSFPRLAGTMLGTLRISAPVLSFVWTGSEDPASAYLSFTGTLLTPVGRTLPDLVLPPAGGVLSGRVTAQPMPDDARPDRERWPDVELTFGEGGFTVGPLQVRDLRYRTTTDPRPALSLPTPTLRVAGTVPFRSGGTERAVSLAAALHRHGDAALFSADFTTAGELSLADVGVLVGQELEVPPGFPSSAAVGLREVTVLLAPDEATPIRSLTATVHMPTTWKLTDKLVIREIDTTFRWEGGAFSVAVTGFIDISSTAVLKIAADSRTRSIGARLRPGDPPLPIRTVWTALTGQTGAHLPDLAVSRFEAAVLLPSPGTPIPIAALLQLDGTWSLINGNLALTHVLFDVAHSSAATAFVAEASVEIASVGVTVRADYDSARGWTFAGGTRPGDEIPVGELFDDLVRKFGGDGLPAALAGLTVSNLLVAFDTKTKALLFTARIDVPVDDDTAVELTVTIDIKPETTGTGYRTALSGVATIGAFRFTLQFGLTAAEATFAATYRHTGEGLLLRDLVAQLSADAARFVPIGLRIELEDALLVLTRTAGGSSVVFAVDVGAGAGLTLTDLPLVGGQLPADATASVDNLRLVIASAELTPDDVRAVNALLRPAQIAPLPDGEALPAGLTVSALLTFGGTSRALTLPVTGADPAGAATKPATPAVPVAVTSSDTAKWFTVQKTLGPLHLARVGVQYRDAVLWFLLDASLSAVGLTLSLDGLVVGSPIDRFAPRVDLRGIGIDYRSPAVEIGAAFLRSTVSDGKGGTYDQYDGAAVLRTKALMLSAIGSYARLADGHPSLFIYAVLDYPIGGPSFFFVTGLAAGFGYNRLLRVPEVDRVADFPLVTQAVDPGPATSAMEALKKLRDNVPPSVGDHFFAIGVKFTSFKMLDCFALLTVAVGNRFELNVLGLATLLVPPLPPGVKQSPAPPLAVVQLAVKASFLPDEGFLGVAAQLTSASYVFSPDCHLTGGFALYCWFAMPGRSLPHAGDFVLTLGGYHPRFPVPAHYPKVPRVGLNWQVNRDLAVKGGGYFALTPSALMAGVSAEASYNGGNLRASFRANADFIVAFKPYHYEAQVSVALRGTYRFRFFGTHEISVDLSADLRLWGPPFSGTARITLSVITFEIEFGDAKCQPAAVLWTDFRSSFLPANPCTIAVTDGLVRRPAGAHDDQLGVLNPKQLALTIDSAVPSTATDLPGADLTPAKLSPVGVAPMDKALTATLTITVTRDGADARADFRFTPVVKRMPTALWGTRRDQRPSAPSFVERALSGFTIVPATDTEPTDGATLVLSRDSYDDRPPNTIPAWEIPATLTGRPITAETVRPTITDPATLARRQRVLYAASQTRIA